MGNSAKSNHTIDINSDLGEGVTLADCEKDEKLMAFISSCNIACGGHAGNELTMKTCLENAAKHQLKIGAHPGYNDKSNFGRISINITQEELQISLKQQIDSLNQLAVQQNIQLHHIKFHGALYNDIETNHELALNLVKFCKINYPSFKLLGLAGGNLQSECNNLNLEFIAEGFMDRRYLSNGRLSPRIQAGALITDLNIAIDQALALASYQPIKTIDQKGIRPKVNSICLHGDNLNALSIAKALHNAMLSSDIAIV